jgi:hypothetical protein
MPVSINAKPFGSTTVFVTLNESKLADPAVPRRGNIDISPIFVNTTESSIYNNKIFITQKFTSKDKTVLFLDISTPDSRYKYRTSNPTYE